MAEGPIASLPSLWRVCAECQAQSGSGVLGAGAGLGEGKEMGLEKKLLGEK